MALTASLFDILDVLRRRAALVLGIIILGFSGSLYLGLGQRPVYESVETLGIAPPRIASDIVSTTVTEPLDRQLPALARDLTSDAVLSQIITAYELYAPGTFPTFSTPETELRNAVEFETREDPETGLSQLRITARLEDREEARLVAQELGHRLIKASVQQRIAEASGTLDYLIEAEQALQADLWALQSRYAAFRRDNADLLEGGEHLRSAEMQSLSAALVDVERQKVALQHEAEQTPNNTTRQADINSELDMLLRQAEMLEQRRQDLAKDMLVPSGFTAEKLGFERELQRLREELAAASARRSLGETGLEVETRRQSERLIVTEPATLPEQPVIDTRGTVVALGGGVSAILAMVIALILDMRNPVLRTPNQMRRQTGITPIATIPFRPKPSLFPDLDDRVAPPPTGSTPSGQ